MKLIPVKLYALSLFTLLLFPPLIQANEPDHKSMEGVLRAIKHTPENTIQIKLDNHWYSIDNNIDIYICGEKTTEKNSADLSEFINLRLSIPPLSGDPSNTIHVLCE